MKIRWSELAIDRLNDIIEYISADNTQNALNWSQSVFSEIEKLKSFPQMGRMLPEINNKNIREIIYGNYRIIYKQESPYISILKIRNFKKILPSEEIK